MIRAVEAVAVFLFVVLVLVGVGWTLWSVRHRILRSEQKQDELEDKLKW